MDIATSQIYENVPNQTPGYLRHLSKNRTTIAHTDIQIYYGTNEDGGRQLEISIYLAPEPGKPSYTVSETVAYNLANLPPADASIEDLKALVQRWLTIARDPAPNSNIERIAYSELPRLLSALARAQHGDSILESHCMLQVDQGSQYGRLIIGQILEKSGPGYDVLPILKPGLIDHLASRVPLELMLYKEISSRASRRPEHGLPKHVSFALKIPGDDDFEWNFYPAQELAGLTLVDELKMLRTLVDLGPDFLLPFVQSDT